MSAPEPPPLNDLEHLLVAAASRPSDPSLGAHFARTLLDTPVGVAGRLHEGNEFTPFLVGTTARHHVAAFTHPARFERFARLVRLDPGVQSQALTGRDAFQRLVPSGIPLLINPQSSYGKEFTVSEMSALLNGLSPSAAPPPPGPGPQPAINLQNTMPVALEILVGPPAYVVPGLYERLAGYFDWLGGIDEAALLWCRYPDGFEGYQLKIRTRMPREHVVAQLHHAIGDLQGRTLDAIVDDWQQPPWNHGVQSFYLRRY